ncbi:unnamed protein product [Periconia digitata]|uniref:Uncharacterized protein n=1 Tax=Periconia digitata TaxID=1303443 RepID=A0A9W4UKQ4_9PLEO|nr:unnamed protein product [Periconia digitata]
MLSWTLDAIFTLVGFIGSSIIYLVVTWWLQRRRNLRKEGGVSTVQEDAGNEQGKQY